MFRLPIASRATIATCGLLSARRSWTDSAAKLTLGSVKLQKAMDEVQMQFAEARELVAEAHESLGSSYFADDIEDAKAATEEAVQQYKELLERCDEKAADRVEKENHLKFRQLEAELQSTIDAAN